MPRSAQGEIYGEEDLHMDIAGAGLKLKLIAVAIAVVLVAGIGAMFVMSNN